MISTIRELPVGETRLAYRALLELRPAFSSERAFVERIDARQRPEGYRLVAAFVNSDEDAAAAAGFRTGHFLAWGHVLYCDDLSTRTEYRARGLAGQLLDWLVAEARRLGCDELHLDSGFGPARQAAHRLYMNKGLRISALHFQQALDGTG